MARPLQSLGLKGAILGSFTLALLAVLGGLYVLVPRQVNAYLLGVLEAEGRSVALEVARALGPSRPDFDRASLAIGQATFEHPEVEWAVAVANDAQGTLLGKTSGADVLEGVASFRAEGGKLRMSLPDGGLLVAEPLFDPGGLSGHVLVKLRTSGIAGLLRDVRRMVLGAFLPGFLILLAGLFAISRRFLLNPLHEMRAMASRLSEADLTGKLAAQGADEMGQLAGALNQISHSLRDTLARIRGVSEGLSGVIEQISRTAHTVSTGAGTIQARVEETSSSMEEMLASLRGIAQNVEVLYRSAEESSASISQMAATNDEVARNVEAMAASVEETTSAIEEMTFSIKEVAKNVEALLASTEETSSSMNEMDVSIRQVESHANETARLSEQVAQDAETGVHALRKTLSGIDRIKDSSRTASNVIEGLTRRIQEIGNIVDVIDDVAEQTNLLALNAAIIAAQAGEHGKGFAVVAEEIKELAERTATSTQEIDELIQGVQEQSRHAVAAVNTGVKNVEEGVLLGREAEGALKKIQESSHQATLMVKAIARATVEQARGSKNVTASIQRIAEAVGQISKATSEQARGSEQIIKSSERMKLITHHVQRSSQEQANGSKQITRAIESINEMLTHLNRAQNEQTLGSEQVLRAVETIKGVSEHQTRSVRQLEEAVEALQSQAEVLRSEARRFRV